MAEKVEHVVADVSSLEESTLEHEPIDPGGHVPIRMTLVSNPVRYYGVQETFYESEREVIGCIVCRQEWPCDRLEVEHPGLRDRVKGAH